MNKKWNLYETVPVLMSHPSLRIDDEQARIPVIISKIKKGIVYWNLDFIVNQAMTGQGGSGFPETPVKCKPVFDPENNRWICDASRDGREWIYYFYFPDDAALTWWEDARRHVESVEELQRMAEKVHPKGI